MKKAHCLFVQRIPKYLCYWSFYSMCYWSFYSIAPKMIHAGDQKMKASSLGHQEDHGAGGVRSGDDAVGVLARGSQSHSSKGG